MAAREENEKGAPLELSDSEFAGAPVPSSPDTARIPSSAAEAPPMTRSLTRQQIALQEAEDVLKVAARSIEGFNLLGVVANPRGPHDPRLHQRSSSRSNIMAGLSSPQPTPTTGEHGSGLEDTILALESTLHSVTEQIDSINTVVDQWSRQYLGTLYYYEEDDYTSYNPPPAEAIVGQLTELPAELSSLSLASVQGFLEENGVLAHSFDARRTPQRQEAKWHESIAPDSNLGDLEENDVEFMESLEQQIPSKFFETYFDLTDSFTFSELLVVTAALQEEEECSEPEITDGSDLVASLPSALSEPTRNILRLPPPDSFTGFLDKVELALLQQVRSKSIAFFHETNRFGQLKEWITSLVEEVCRVRKLLANVQEKSVVAWELIPLLDKQRQDLMTLNGALEGANDVIRCKSSIGGLLSANDDLGAAEQIQYGRTLLEDPQLSKLLALKTVHDQFSQYETLVVANLGEELVEILLDWKSYNTSTNRIKEMVKGLELCNALQKISQLYSSRQLDVIRMTVRTTVGEFAEEADSSVKACVTSMTLERFSDCLDMLFEQILDICKSAKGVQDFGKANDVDFGKADTVTAAAELSSKSISELLRLRKEAHSLMTLVEMKKLSDVCMTFVSDLETLSNYKPTALRSTLLAQAKAFVERQHESNMSSLVAALDSERWTQCDVSTDRQAALTRLCTGRARPMADSDSSSAAARKPTVDVEGVNYKVVWSCLLMIEMVLNNIAGAAHFSSLATNVVGKVSELLRLFNSRSTQLVLGAGAIHSAARLKSINAKHLSLVTQCLGLTIAILPQIRAALMAQLAPKAHNLLDDLDKIRKEYSDHNEKVLNKFVTIIGGIVEHNLAPRIPTTNFDTDTGDNVFLEGVATNTRKMHQVLSVLLPPDHLRDVFSRIFAHVDQTVPDLFEQKAVAQQTQHVFSFPTKEEGKRQMLTQVDAMTVSLNKLSGVRPWEFTAVQVLERKLDFTLNNSSSAAEVNGGVAIPVQETNVAPPVQEAKVVPPVEEEDNVAPPVQDANAIPLVQEEANVVSPVQEENVAPPVQDASSVPPVQEEANVALSVQEDFNGTVPAPKEASSERMPEADSKGPINGVGATKEEPPKQESAPSNRET